MAASWPASRPIASARGASESRRAIRARVSGWVRSSEGVGDPPAGQEQGLEQPTLVALKLRKSGGEAPRVAGQARGVEVDVELPRARERELE
jgi:hypothetical protein